MKSGLDIAMLSIHSCPLSKLGGRDTGGMNVYIRELSRELSERGYRVDIYTRSHQFQHSVETHLAENVRLIHLNNDIDDDMFKLAFPQYYKSLSHSLDDYKKKHGLNYDLIHSHYWQSGMVGKQLQEWWHVPHITMFHTLGAIKKNLGMSQDDPPSRLEGEIQVVQTCDRIITSTEREKEHLETFYNASLHKIDTIPCGVNLDLFKPVEKRLAREALGLNSERIILFVGRLEPLKGVDQLLLAFSYLRDRLPARLIIIGGDDSSSPNTRRIKDKAKQLNVMDSTFFGGPVTQKTLPLLYSASDVCVIPSYYESFGLVALESLACGTPVIATDVGVMKKIIADPRNGYVLQDNSAGRLSYAIVFALNQGRKTRENIKFRRDSISQYDWGKVTDMVLETYHCVNIKRPMQALV